MHVHRSLDENNCRTFLMFLNPDIDRGMIDMAFLHTPLTHNTSPPSILASYLSGKMDKTAIPFGCTSFPRQRSHASGVEYLACHGAGSGVGRLTATTIISFIIASSVPGTLMAIRLLVNQVSEGMKPQGGRTCHDVLDIDIK
jgi:hypothetical protein